MSLATAPAPGELKVTVVGDSLTYNATRFFPIPWVLRAQVGRAMYESMTAVQNAVSKDRAQVVVLAQGSNDVNDRRSATAMRNTLAQALEILTPVAHVLVTSVKVQGVNPFYGTQWKSYAAQWNTVIRNDPGSADAPRLIVADWNNYCADHPGWFVADGLHMTDNGERAYANFLKNQVRINTSA